MQGGQGASTPEVCRALRVARERAGLERAGVARVSGVTTAELRRIEAGESRPSIALLQRLASAVGTRLTEIVRLANEPSAGVPVAKATEAADARGASRTRSHLGVEELAQAIVELPAAVGSKVDVVASAAVLHAMAACRNNQSAAARLLGMERKAFVRRLQRARRRRK